MSKKQMKGNKAKEVHLGSGLLSSAAKALSGRQKKLDKEIDAMVDGIPHRRR